MNIPSFSLPKTTVKLRPRTAQEADKNLNLINNNKSREEDSEEKGARTSRVSFMVNGLCTLELDGMEEQGVELAVKTHSFEKLVNEPDTDI